MDTEQMSTCSVQHDASGVLRLGDSALLLPPAMQLLQCSNVPFEGLLFISKKIPGSSSSLRCPLCFEVRMCLCVVWHLNIR